MSDKFFPSSLLFLLKQVLKSDNKIFGIEKEHWFFPNQENKISIQFIDKQLDTPIGVAAGPHSQLAQNIVAAWLCGARYIELKTIQTLDELDVTKPCIDMQDEGYNCEWSQELKIQQSFEEYLNAWILIHVLNHKFFGNQPINTVFNMSVGYNMEGILKENVQWFFDKMQNALLELEKKIEEIKSIYPQIIEINIPVKISDNITLSTMHGCPANEIEQIGLYLITQKKLNTLIKLNPTLLGADDLRKILNENLGFETVVPDLAFEHDLKYKDSISIIQNLQKAAESENVFFGVKLTNTLESSNIKGVFTGEMMYMSGRALHPISINVARKLQNEFSGNLNVSFAGGIDVFNVVDVLKCGLYPVTVSSDLLKPAGYTRLKQYTETILAQKNDMNQKSFRFSEADKFKPEDFLNSRLLLLNKYADKVLKDQRYKRTNFKLQTIKTKRKLSDFDCIAAPCIDTCPTHQDIPTYMHQTAEGNFELAFQTIMKTNPFPNSTGMVCDHLCQTKCTRINYDNSLLIREIKRFLAENYKGNFHLKTQSKNGLKVAIIGAGASGLSAAYFLVLAGFEVNVYEAKEQAGGMVRAAIPSFRLETDSLNADIERIKELGVNIYFNYKINKTEFDFLRKQNDFVYISVGAQKSKQLNIKGIDAENVFEPLQFLFDVKIGKITNIGKRIGVIGGGNTAMDTVRTANRLVGNEGKTVLIYRRSKKQMPAEFEEIQAVINEGIEILELTAPEEVIIKNGKIYALKVFKMKLGRADSSGRAEPVKIQNSEYEILLDALIPAIGQDFDIDFVDNQLLNTSGNSYETRLENVFIGGDALRGASNLINAIADGRKTAEEIIRKAQFTYNLENKSDKNFDEIQLKIKKSKRVYSENITETEVYQKQSFKLITKTLTQEQAQKEAERCLLCDEICDICVSVCPNLANFSYQIDTKIFKLPEIELINGEIVNSGEVKFEVAQSHQVMNIRDWCNECGNCNTFCPTADAPYKSKPHLHLSEKSYNAESEGYIMRNLLGKQVLFYKSGDYDEPSIESLTFYNNIYSYENDYFIAHFEKEGFKFKEIKFKIPHSQKADLLRAAQMSIVMQAVSEWD